MPGVLDLCERDEGRICVYDHLGYLVYGLLIGPVSTRCNDDSSLM